MNADQVRALVAATFPGVLDSPLAVACASFAASDEADRACEFASLQARATEAEARRVRADAMEHARACIDACGGWTVETLGHNIQSSFGHELDADECDEIARKALAAAGGTSADHHHLDHLETTTMKTRPTDLFSPAEREAAETFIFQRLAQLGAPADVVQATRSHLNFLEVAETAHERLRQAAPELYESWDDLCLMDPGTPREAIDAWIAAAMNEPAAAYHLGFAQAVVLQRIELQAVTGRDF